MSGIIYIGAFHYRNLGLIIVCCLCLITKTIYKPTVIKVSVRMVEIAVPVIENTGASSRFKNIFTIERDASTAV